MQSGSKRYLSKLKDFLPVESVSKLKDIVDGMNIKLRYGSLVSDYGRAVQGGLQAWGAGKTNAQTVNVLGETALRTHALGEAITEWKKRHYLCCVCSGVACSCFHVCALTSYPKAVPSGEEAAKRGSR